MKRVELFEFEDFNWFPNVIRTGVTNLIAVLHRLTGTSEIISGLILEMNKRNTFSNIIDLGSGSGGPMPEVIEKINSTNQNSDMQLILTDKNPNLRFAQKINKQQLTNIKYRELPVDATNVTEDLKGLKTMIASFHHMNPTVALKILMHAQESKEPILIYEIAKNTIPLLIWSLLLPVSLVILILMTLFMTPFVRPLSFSQILFTYLIPIIPIVYAWDGQASLMRTYTFKDIEQLLGNKDKPDYKWKIGDAKKANGKKAGYYIMGYPQN